jgi:hypothetical protein
MQNIFNAEMREGKGATSRNTFQTILKSPTYQREVGCGVKFPLQGSDLERSVNS